jgi:hypothetical protein
MAELIEALARLEGD